MKKFICLSFALLSIMQSIAQEYNYDEVFHDYEAYNPNCNIGGVFSANTSIYDGLLDELFGNPMAIILLGHWEESTATIPSCIYAGSLDRIYTTYRIQEASDININDRSDSHLTTLYIGAGVHEIGKNTFRGFTSLKNVIIEENGTLLKGECNSGDDRCNYNFDSKEILCQLEKIEDYAFADCNNLENVTLPSSIKYIGDYAFYSEKREDNKPLTITCNALQAPQIGENSFPEGSKLIVPPCATGYQEWGFKEIEGGVPISADDFDLNYTKTYDGTPYLDLGNNTSFEKDKYTISIDSATIFQLLDNVLQPCGDATSDNAIVQTQIKFTVYGNGCDNTSGEYIIPNKVIITPDTIDLKQILEDHVFAKKIYDSTTTVEYQDGIKVEYWNDGDIKGTNIEFELPTEDILQFVFYKPPYYEGPEVGKQPITIPDGGFNILNNEHNFGNRNNYSITNDFKESKLSVDGWIYQNLGKSITIKQICDGNNSAVISSDEDIIINAGYCKIAVNNELRLNQTVPFNNDTIIGLSIPNDITPATYTGTLVFALDSDGNDTISNICTFTMDIIPPDVIKQLYHNVIFVDNAYNHYTKYQWYKDDQLLNGETKQYITERPELTGRYSVDVTTQNGIKLHSCPTKTFTPTSKLSPTVTSYPNPAKEGVPFTIKLIGGVPEDASIMIFNNAGAQVMRIDNITENTTITLPRGYYSGALISNGKKSGFKIIVE